MNDDDIVSERMRLASNRKTLKMPLGHDVIRRDKAHTRNVTWLPSSVPHSKARAYAHVTSALAYFLSHIHEYTHTPHIHMGAALSMYLPVSAAGTI